jgi:hypothetical protein
MNLERRAERLFHFIPCSHTGQNVKTIFVKPTLKYAPKTPILMISTPDKMVYRACKSLILREANFAK